MRLVREHREAVATKARGHPAHLVDIVDNRSILVSLQFLQERTCIQREHWLECYQPFWMPVRSMGISTCVFSCVNTVHSKSSEATHSTSLMDYLVLSYS